MGYAQKEETKVWGIFFKKNRTAVGEGGIWERAIEGENYLNSLYKCMELSMNKTFY